MQSFIEQHPIRTKINVAWGEMDALQHVNNVVYFRYFETARIDFFTQLGFLKDLQVTGVGPVISENNARYKRPVAFPDTVHVGVKISDIEQDRFMMHYTVFSESQDTVTTIGSSQVVMFNFKTGKKAQLNDELLTALKAHSSD